MELSDTFSIARPYDDAWRLLHDPSRLAPCVPGAQLTAVHGDRYDGIVSVRLGVLAARFEGSATFDFDGDRRRIIVQAAGAGNHGFAEAHITARLEPLSDDSTQVNVDTDLQVGGRFAQLSRGVIAEVSTALTAQFAGNLAASIDVERHLGSDVFASAGGKRIEMPEPEALDLLDAARRPIMKRLIPLAMLLALTRPTVRRLRRRRVGRTAGR